MSVVLCAALAATTAAAAGADAGEPAAAAAAATAPAKAEPSTAAAQAAGDSGHSKRCGGEAPTKLCVAFERSPRLPNDDPRTRAVIDVWRRVEAPFAALTGRETGLVVLGPEGRYGEGAAAKPFPPAAYICPGAPPVVYVPYPLVELVLVQKKYPIDFMAFVIGHELGHRANDFTLDGCQLAAFQRPGKGRYEEELADKRSAFFTAVAGYSTRALAREDTVSGFLAAEFGMRPFDVKGRKASVLEALGSFEALESLYQSAVALALSGETQAAARLLGWAEELIRGHGVPLPEMLVARALVLMMNAAPQAPWTEAAKLPVDASHLRCAPIYASHTALWEEPEPGAAVRGAGDEREAARRALLLARKLLDEAGQMGAAPLTIAAGQACVALYLGEPDVAARHQQAADRLVGKRSPKTVRDALAANAALIAFGAAVGRQPAPAQTDDKALAKWGKAIARGKRAFAAHGALAAVVAQIAALPKRGTVPANAKRKPTCAGNDAAKPPALSLPAAEAPARKLGACPAGWRLAHTLPAIEIAMKTGSPTGVTTCVPADGRDGIRWVSVDLPSVTSPPLDELRVRMRVVEARAMAMPKLGAWACACGESMEMMGLSDLGEAGYMVACEAMGVALGVIFAGDDGAITRVVAIDSD